MDFQEEATLLSMASLFKKFPAKPHMTNRPSHSVLVAVSATMFWL